MKKEALLIIEKKNLKLIKWESYRSDMGTQVYHIIINNGNRDFSFHDGYFAGEDGRREQMKKSIFDFIHAIPSVL